MEDRSGKRNSRIILALFVQPPTPVHLSPTHSPHPPAQQLSVYQSTFPLSAHPPSHISVHLPSIYLTSLSTYLSIPPPSNLPTHLPSQPIPTTHSPTQLTYPSSHPSTHRPTKALSPNTYPLPPTPLGSPLPSNTYPLPPFPLTSPLGHLHFHPFIHPPISSPLPFLTCPGDSPYKRIQAQTGALPQKMPLLLRNPQPQGGSHLPPHQQ